MREDFDHDFLPDNTANQMTEDEMRAFMDTWWIAAAGSLMVLSLCLR